ncbi:MAG TPA: patatin-like phospholipase family protein [Chitinophagaceae bacterium]|nr:patatin-like phospholipase family protein [Chitinophagaceae bacterium]
MKNLIVVLLFICFEASLSAQTKPVIRNLVFEGAGLRGIAYSGAVAEMEARSMMGSIEKVGGTSSGAIVALAISLGYSGKEIQDIISETNFRKFNDGRYFFIGGINRISKYFGWYRGKRFENWLKKIIFQKTGNADITFEELYEKKFKDLYITGTCLNKQQLVIFSRAAYPKMKVTDAIRISMSIPLYFEAVFINKEGKIIHHPKQTQGLDIMVDGGITGNFPIRMFDSLSQTNFSTLGFRIDSEEQIKNDREGKSIASIPVGNLKQYLYAFYNIMIETLNRQPLTKADWQRTISISDGSVKPRIRKLSAGEINILINNGREAIKTYLN